MHCTNTSEEVLENTYVAAGPEHDLISFVKNADNYRKAKRFFFYAFPADVINEQNITEKFQHDIAIIELESDFELGERTGTHRVLVLIIKF